MIGTVQYVMVRLGMKQYYVVLRSTCEMVWYGVLVRDGTMVSVKVDVGLSKLVMITSLFLIVVTSSICLTIFIISPFGFFAEGAAALTLAARARALALLEVGARGDAALAALDLAQRDDLGHDHRRNAGGHHAFPCRWKTRFRRTQISLAGNVGAKSVYLETQRIGTVTYRKVRRKRPGG